CANLCILALHNISFWLTIAPFRRILMTAINPTIFRKYDIRGTATGDNPQLTPDVARLVGKALGTYLPQHFGTARVFVGMDNRLTSPPLKMAMIEGLTSTGMNVTDIGQVITP